MVLQARVGEDVRLAVDRAQLTANLSNFYDFTGKVVLCVGAGGGLLLDPSIVTRSITIIDRDESALAKTKAKISASGGHVALRTVVADFTDVSIPADVVYFEFCLHEMDHPKEAIIHARRLAADVVIFEHCPESDWIFYAAEEDKVRRSAEAVKNFRVRRGKTLCAEQRFANHSELVAKLSTQGDLAIQRAARFIGATNIAIPMSYELTLL